MSARQPGRGRLGRSALLLVGLISLGLAQAETNPQPATTSTPDGTILRDRALRFVPLADGREAVFEGNSMRLVHMLGADKNKESFLRVTIRILQVTRQHHGIDTSNPFHLVVRAGQGLVLEDPLTKSSLPIRAFGEHAVSDVSPLLVAPTTEIVVLPPKCSRLEC